MHLSSKQTPSILTLTPNTHTPKPPIFLNSLKQIQNLAVLEQNEQKMKKKSDLLV